MWHRENFIGMSFYFVDVNRVLLLMRKPWIIIHKLSIAQKGFMSNFWMIRQLTHWWSLQKQFIPYNPNFVAEMVRFFTILNFFGACGRKIAPGFLHGNLLKSKKFISTNHIAEKKTRWWQFANFTKPLLYLICAVYLFKHISCLLFLLILHVIFNFRLDSRAFKFILPNSSQDTQLFGAKSYCLWSDTPQQLCEWGLRFMYN